MKIVSFVPSWTETLFACGANVVGRTRFCVHPEPMVKSIAVVGGTKDLKLDVVRSLAPDLVLLDREENTREMAESLGEFRTCVTHIRSVDDCAGESARIAEEFARSSATDVARKFEALGSRWMRVSETPSAMRAPREWPGVIEWIGEVPPDAAAVCYLIWRDPWMAVSRGTFIASVLEKVGVSPTRDLQPGNPASRYPVIEALEDLPSGTILLFSSEPYPFGKKKSEIAHLPFPKAIVDGEAFSWFGVRSLKFIERSLGIRHE
ncbi:MAG: helical backbone metal receptor [Bdellovibrionota bacterium]